LTSRDSLMQNIFSLLIAPSFSQFHAPSIRWRCGNFCSKAGVSFSALFLDPVTVQLHSEIQNLRSDQQRDPDRFLSERDHMELSTFFLTAAMVRQSIIRTATVSRSNSAIDWIDPGPSDAGTGIVSAAFAEKPLERTHRDCNRRILAGVIASGVVAVSRIRGTDGPGARTGERKFAASLPRSGNDRTRASLAGTSRQGNAPRRLIRGHIESDHCGGDAILVLFYGLVVRGNRCGGGRRQHLESY
jgi:hypothetical protein